MSILSSIGSAVKSAYNTVSSVYNAAYNLGSNIGSAIKNAFSGSSNTASVANAVPSSSNTTPATQTKTISTQAPSQNTQSSGPVTISSSSSNYSPLTGYASNPVSMNTTISAPKTLNSSNIKTSSPIIPTTINSNLYPTTNSNYYGSSTGNVVAPQGVKTLTTGGMSSDQQGSSSIATGTQNGNKFQFDKNGVQKPQTMEEIIAQQKALYPDSVDYATMYKEAQNQTGVIEKQNTVNNLTNQLNSINSETETALSRLRGVGAKEGVTEFVYGQQSAEILREGQMKASPIQAQLQAAQGDLQSAQNTLDTLYKLKVQTAEQNYKKWTNIVDTSRDIFDKQQQKLIDDKKTVFANNSKRLSDSVNFAQQLAVKLLETKPNLSQLISSLREPDTMSPTFNEDLQAYNQQIAKYAGQAGVSTDGQTGSQNGVALYSGLSSATATAVRAKVSKFSTEPLVQNFATIQEGKNFASSIPDVTTNPADDQGLIYSLAKVLDPGSVVREGEYATAQKYSQSWVKAFGKGVTQAINGTGFLSEEARKNIKSTIESKYKASEKSYKNLQSSYTEGINKLTGRTNGSDFLIEYAIPESNQNTENKTSPQIDRSNVSIDGLKVSLPDGTIWVAPSVDALNKFKMTYGL